SAAAVAAYDLEYLKAKFRGLSVRTGPQQLPNLIDENSLTGFFFSLPIDTERRLFQTHAISTWL
ncbi:MAG TPA: hypothetical protein DEQ02_01460, partial [Ruminococcaceae bacterium]|nr:hypothetical protein [Oscillospiraceae bacterium]